MQASFSDLEYAAKKKVTRRDRFLGEIEAVTPWSALAAEIEPFCPRGVGRGRPPIGLERMLRMYVAQYVTQAHALLHGADTALGRLDEQIEQDKASVRAKVEHPFHIIKNLFGLRKVRYRGLVKNTAQLFTLFGLNELLGRGLSNQKGSRGKLSFFLNELVNDGPHARPAHARIELL